MLKHVPQYRDTMGVADRHESVVGEWGGAMHRTRETERVGRDVGGAALGVACNLRDGRAFNMAA
ncbi:hypothetical protein SE18_19470 [Herpetosiphon geysericola]|uniref:Uncharacterized protein n=1 Tax=Herpetosiphon geysericola TaxID=70996 RepID=A0A0P6XRC7_9CHLR|nr:hypothetical protein SE18_19470 [Herpetosiphon geysericola]